jgi:hypothetical protein
MAYRCASVEISWIFIITKYKTKSLPAVCPYVCFDIKNYQTDFHSVLFNISIYLYLHLCYVMHDNIVKKTLNISYTPAPSRDGSLVTLLIK